jgi:DNA polymerase-3 subunit delta
MSRGGALYLLLGPEEGQKEQFIEGLVARIGKSVGSPPELQRFYAFDVDLTEVLVTLRNGNLFTPHRVVLLRNVELLSRKKELELLEEYCAHPAENATLILVSDEVGRVDRRLERMVPGENRKIFWEMFESQKMGWILSFFKKRKIEIDSQAATFLLEMVENNTRELRDICEKLSLFFGEGSRIDYPDIEKVLYHSKEESVFTLFEKVAQRDFPACLEVLNKLLLSREADPVQLLGGLLAQYRRLMALERLLGQAYSFEEAFSRLSLRSRKIQKVYAEGCRRYSPAELTAIIKLSARFDLRVRALKSVLHACLLELFLYYAVVKGGEGYFRS